MQRKLATIQKVKSVEPILHPEDGTETSIALIKFEDIAWQCVAKRGEFSPGDKAVYIEISSVVPDHPVFEFLRSKSFKVKTVRLLGVLSQGLALPLSILKSLNSVPEGLSEEEFDARFYVGADVTAEVGATRYEPPVNVRINGSGVTRSFPVDIVPKTDEIRLQSIPHILDHLDGIPAVAAEKVDGTSATYFWDNEENRLRVCSRNLEKCEKDDSIYWLILEKVPAIEDFCKSNPHLVLQGEIAGPGIQKNPLKLSEPQFFGFTLYNRLTNSYVSHAKTQQIISDFNLPWVKVVHAFSPFDKSIHTVDFLLNLADGKYEKGGWREGIVVRPTYVEKYVPLFGRLSFKVISNLFLQKGGE
jgi:RNA ligase (TIGR02306 family)